MSEQVIDVDRAPRVQRVVVAAEHVRCLPAPVRDFLLGLVDVPVGARGRRRLRHQAPEEIEVEMALRALDRAVVQLPRRECVELFECGHGAEVIRGPGAPKRKPWASGQPSSRSIVTCSSLSTPSATASMPSARASDTLARTIALSPGEAANDATNELSILTARTGRSRSDEYPVPKSSNASPTPSSCKATTLRRAAFGAACSTRSCTSSRSRPAGSRLEARHSATISGRSGCASCRLATLTQIAGPS